MGVEFHIVWVPSEQQKADGLTRGKKRISLRPVAKKPARIFTAKPHSSAALKLFGRVLAGKLDDDWRDLHHLPSPVPDFREAAHKHFSRVFVEIDSTHGHHPAVVAQKFDEILAAGRVRTS